jgi:hypothetical protein
MPITVPCIKCKTKFQVPSKFAGQKVRCKSCGCMMRLPSPERIQAKKLGAPAGGKPLGPSKPAASQAPRPTSDDLDVVDFFDEPSEPASAPAPGPSAATQDPPVLSCSHCEGLLYYDPNFANQTVACPHCGNHLIMPEL